MIVGLGRVPLFPSGPQFCNVSDLEKFAEIPCSDVPKLSSRGPASQNVLLKEGSDDTLHVCVTDFGLSKQLPGASRRSSRDLDCSMMSQTQLSIHSGHY